MVAMPSACPLARGWWSVMKFANAWVRKQYIYIYTAYHARTTYGFAIWLYTNQPNRYDDAARLLLHLHCARFERRLSDANTASTTYIARGSRCEFFASLCSFALTLAHPPLRVLRLVCDPHQPRLHHHHHHSPPNRIYSKRPHIIRLIIQCWVVRVCMLGAVRDALYGNTPIIVCVCLQFIKRVAPVFEGIRNYEMIGIFRANRHEYAVINCRFELEYLNESTFDYL